MSSYSVCVVGLGYIGLPTAAVMAQHGHSVAGVDLNPAAVATINQGKAHIIEPDLDQAVQQAVESGRLRASQTPSPADFFFICVPTPFLPGDGIPQPDISYVLAASRSLLPVLKDGDTVVLESTSPVGTTQQIADLFAQELPGVQLHLAYCPERVLPGKIMLELIHNDRIIGGMTPEAADLVEALYQTFVKGELLKTNARTAEMVKLVENSYRDVNIAFANELSLMADAMDIDVWELIALANHHPRVKILQPGCGVGGHCIAVDPWFLVSAHPEIAQVIHAGRRTNDSKPHWVAGKVAAKAASVEQPAKIACLGLAYKPDIDDFRESPALEIFHLLAAKGLDVRAVEPYAEPGNPPNVSLIPLEQAVEGCDILVGLVPHAAFKKAELPQDKLMDFCGMAR